MKLVIHGGEDCLGPWLAREALGLGHRVRVHMDSTAEYPEAYAEFTEQAGWAGNLGLHSPAAPGDSFDAWFELSPATGSWRRPRLVRHLEELSGAVDRALACRATLVHAGSSIGIEEQPGDEQATHLRSRRLRSAAVLAGEQLLLAAYHSEGLSTALVRLSHLYGPTPAPGSRDVFSSFARNAAQGRRLDVHGSGRQSRDFLHARDAARLLLLAAVEPRVRGRVLTAGSGVATSITDLARRMSAGSGYRFVAHPAPATEAREGAPVGGTAVALLPWKPQTTLESGVREMLAWAGEQGSIHGKELRAS